MDRQSARWLTQIGAKKKARKQARMLSSLIYFFGPFSIYYILHDYVIPQTHSSFYPHRPGGGGVFQRILDRGVPRRFVNPNPI